MGKYFKEEETSNRIKRFKTSDVQEKNSRFAQVSRVINLLDKIGDFTKTSLGRLFLRAPSLQEVRPEIVEKLKDGFYGIIRANRSLAVESQKKIEPILLAIEEAEKRRTELTNLINKETVATERNKIIRELENIRKFIDKKREELKPLKEEHAVIEKKVKDEIDAQIQEFNSVNRLTDPLSWNGNLSEPKIEFLLGSAVSRKGTQAVMERAREKQKLSVLNFLNQTRRFVGRSMQGFLSDEYSNRLNEIGFFNKKYNFKVKNNKDEWVDEKYSMAGLFEEIIKGGFISGTKKPDNQDVKDQIIKDFEKFNQLSDQIETGVLSPLGRTVIFAVAAATPWVIKNAPVVLTLPQRIQKQKYLNDKTKMPADMESANKNLNVNALELAQISRLESILRNPATPEDIKPALQRKIDKLKKNKNNGR